VPTGITRRPGGPIAGPRSVELRLDRFELLEHPANALVHREQGFAVVLVIFLDVQSTMIRKVHAVPAIALVLDPSGLEPIVLLGVGHIEAGAVQADQAPLPVPSPSRGARRHRPHHLLVKPAQRLRTHIEFLLSLLYSDERGIREAAIEQLREALVGDLRQRGNVALHREDAVDDHQHAAAVRLRPPEHGLELVEPVVAEGADARP
jgi:hypothetical protein